MKSLRLKLPSFCSILLLGIAACATNSLKKQQAFDFSSPGRIELQITANDPSLSIETTRLEVSKNLATWDYPVGAKEGESFSHVLKATVGSVEYADTPTGFSFSSGNSDPRAMGFQKTFVLPITCQLSSIAHHEQSGELKLGFSTDETSKIFLGSDKLADHISTVCFNLLTELKWPIKPKQNTDTTTIKTPSWMPEIRIESKEVPVAPVNKATRPDDNKASPVNSNDNEGVEAKTIAPTTEHRKQIIIYNQGSPVILELGHERK
jgi:hypothetical protein